MNDSHSTSSPPYSRPPELPNSRSPELSPSRTVNSVKILGSTVNMVDVPYITSWLDCSVDQYDGGNAKQLLVTGFHGLNRANRDDGYFMIGEQCDLWVPDSIAPVLIARKRGMRDVVRTAGAEIMEAFFELAEARGLSSYFYGDSDATLTALREQLQTKYPNHTIAGMYSPPFRPLSEKEEQEHIDMINEAAPNVLWVGLGLPKQDEWIHRCKDRLQVPVAAGVGAAFGFHAGTIRRAPAAWRKLGLEWLYMLLRTPKRTGRRVFIEGGQFMRAVIQEELSRLFRRSGSYD